MSETILVPFEFDDQDIPFDTAVKALARWWLRTPSSVDGKIPARDAFEPDVIREIVTEEIIDYGLFGVDKTNLESRTQAVVEWARLVIEDYRQEQRATEVRGG